MSKVFGYGRHSTDKQEHTEEVQRERVMKYYLEKLADLDWGGWFYDSDQSAKLEWDRREKGRELALAMQSGDWIVTADCSRIFRKNSDTFRWLEQFAERGIYWRSLDLLGTDQLRPAERSLVEGQVLIVKQYERDVMRQRELDRVAHHIANDTPYGRNNSSPIGWYVKAIGKRREFRVHHDERRLCDHMQGLRDAGMSLEEISWWWFMSDKRGELTGRKTRRFATRHVVRWALRARRAGYPLRWRTRDQFTKAWCRGEVMACQIQSA